MQNNNFIQKASASYNMKQIYIDDGISIKEPLIQPEKKNFKINSLFYSRRKENINDINKKKYINYKYVCISYFFYFLIIRTTTLINFIFKMFSTPELKNPIFFRC